MAERGDKSLTHLHDEKIRFDAIFFRIFFFLQCNEANDVCKDAIDNEQNAPAL